MENPIQFVSWLRSVAPYVHAFRGKTFVVAFPGELVAAGALSVLAHDLSLLHALDINVTVVYGSRPQVAEQLALRNVEGRFHNGVRITDTAAMECAKEAAGEQRLAVFARRPLPRQREDGLGQADDEGQGREQGQAHDERQGDADPPRPRALMLGQLVREDGDEDQIVDAEHHLHDHEGHERGPGGRVAHKGGDIHRGLRCITYTYPMSFIRV